MSKTKRKPLLSDERIDNFIEDGEPRQYVFGAITVGKIVRDRYEKDRDIYEADREKKDETIELLLEALESLLPYAAAHSLARINGTLCREELDKAHAAIAKATQP